MSQYTEEELLEATGNRWKVSLYADGTYKKFLGSIIVSAELQSIAEEKAIRRTKGARVASACAWNPLDEAWGQGGVFVVERPTTVEEMRT